MKALCLSALIASATPAVAHPILTFDYAYPGVGMTVDRRTINHIALYFMSDYDSADVEIRLQGVLLHLVPSRHRQMVMARMTRLLKPGTYHVAWRMKHDDGQWHTYVFVAE
jgi:methionine-rich copper-binding protein CopC